MKPREFSSGLAALVLIILGSALLIWSIWPVPRQRAILVVEPDRLAPLSGEESGRQIILEYPATMRLGDAGQVDLSFEPVSTRQAPTSTFPGQSLAHAEVESHLDLTGIPLSPEDLSQTALLPGKPARFIWALWPVNGGDYSGRAWMSIRIFRTDGSSEEDRAISAQPLVISVRSILGLRTPVVRILGGTAIALGALVGAFFYVKIRSFS
ncbi:MAG: hypothetical protein PHQ40_14085 [Anaerolineaceae bacterium]|nr:hypothetical protein [Anaerolineaceae bacterium]